MPATTSPAAVTAKAGTGTDAAATGFEKNTSRALTTGALAAPSAGAVRVMRGASVPSAITRASVSSALASVPLASPLSPAVRRSACAVTEPGGATSANSPSLFVRTCHGVPSIVTSASPAGAPGPSSARTRA